MRRKEVPDWLKELWTELTTPPRFLNVAPNKTMPTADEQEVNSVQTHVQPTQEKKTKYFNEELMDNREEIKNKDIDLVLRANGFSPKVLKQYPFETIQVVPFGSVMRLHTSDGIIALKKSKLSPKRIQFMADALQHVEKKGFTRFSKFIPNQRKNPFTPIGEQVYYATSWVAGRQADFSSMVQVAETASAIAEFHHASRLFESPGYSPPAAFDIGKVLQARADDFDLFIAKARSKRKRDAVDQFVLRHAPTFKKQALQAVKLLSDSRCQDFLQFEERNSGLCHLDITPRNLVFSTKKGMHLIDFDRMSYGPRMLDLGHMIRRSLQANDWQREPALVALVQVNKVEPLRHAEYRILQSILTFPQSVWRSCYNHYMKQPTPYTLARLEELYEQEPARQAFLDDFAQHVERHRGY